MNKWVSVALCICGLGLGGMMLTGDSDGGRVLIENAPYITDGKINPNHEGKVVIVAGKMATEEPAADEELGISFDSPIIKRNVHVLDCGRKRLPAGRKYFPDGVFLLFRGPEMCYHTQ